MLWWSLPTVQMSPESSPCVTSVCSPLPLLTPLGPSLPFFWQGTLVIAHTGTHIHTETHTRTGIGLQIVTKERDKKKSKDRNIHITIKDKNMQHIFLLVIQCTNVLYNPCCVITDNNNSITGNIVLPVIYSPFDTTYLRTSAIHWHCSDLNKHMIQSETLLLYEGCVPALQMPVGHDRHDHRRSYMGLFVTLKDYVI